MGQNYRESMLNGQQDELLTSHTDRYARGYFAKSGLTFDLGQDRLLLNYDIYHNNNDNYTLSDGHGDLPFKRNPKDLREAFTLLRMLPIPVIFKTGSRGNVSETFC